MRETALFQVVGAGSAAIPAKASRKGPLFYHSESATWYRNGGFTSEFLLDRNLPLSECMSVVFDDHHTSYCRKDGSQCAYLGKRDFAAGAELFAQLVGHNHKNFLKLFLDANSSSKCLNFSAAQAYSHLKKALKVPEKANGIIRHEHPAAPVLISAILDHYGFGRRKGATRLCGLFKNIAEGCASHFLIG